MSSTQRKPRSPSQLNPRLAEFIAAGRAQNGDPATIADAILPKLFPGTWAVAGVELCRPIFRNGLVTYCRDFTKREGNNTAHPAQLSVWDIDPELMPAVARLPHQTFSIPSVGDGPSNDYLHIGALLADLPKLDEARKFMRLKEHEVGALADQLDEIYEAAIKLGRPAATLRVPQEEHTE